MKKLFTTVLLSVVTVFSAFAETDNYYHWFYNKVMASPATGRGVIYASASADEQPADADYKSEMEVKQYDFGTASSNVMCWAKPADGYQFGGWFLLSSSEDPLSMKELKSTQSDGAIISVTTKTETEGSEVESYAFEPDNYIYGLFTKVAVSVAEGLESVGTVDIDKLSNGTGDEVTMTATPSNEGTKFAYWLDADGKKYTDNPLKMTVSGINTYTAYFEGDSILCIDFGEGKYIPFSNKYSGTMQTGITAYYVGPLEKSFYDENGIYITYDETNGAWGHNDDQYDNDGNLVSSTFIPYEGEIPTFDSSWEFKSYSYNYTQNTGAVLYGEGKKYIVLYNDDYAVATSSYLNGTAEAPFSIDDFYANADNEGTFIYTFNGTDFVRTITGTVEQGSCYIALDADQYPLPEKIYLGTTDPDGISSAKAAAPQFMGVYTINGQKVTAPVKGINIIGGKKVMVK